MPRRRVIFTSRPSLFEAGEDRQCRSTAARASRSAVMAVGDLRRPADIDESRRGILQASRALAPLKSLAMRPR